MSATILCPIFK